MLLNEKKALNTKCTNSSIHRHNIIHNVSKSMRVSCAGCKSYTDPMHMHTYTYIHTNQCIMYAGRAVKFLPSLSMTDTVTDMGLNWTGTVVVAMPSLRTSIMKFRVPSEISLLFAVTVLQAVLSLCVIDNCSFPNSISVPEA